VHSCAQENSTSERRCHSYVHTLHALDITTGTDKSAPTVVSAYVQGASGEVVFTALPKLQRPGLLLSSNTIYFGLGSNGCEANAQGWVLAYGATSLQQVRSV
jgi:hypothetical protein